MKEICAIRKSVAIRPKDSFGVIQTFYDIVKAHGGVPIAIGIKVETRESEGSEFIVQLPIV